VESSMALQGDVEAEFRVNTPDHQQRQLYCCLYKDALGIYSRFSPYLSLEQQQPLPPGAAPTSSPAPPPSPVLSVEPPSGRVRRGQMLSFHCSLPVTQRQPQRQSQPGLKPLIFLLVKEGLMTGDTSLVIQPQANRTADAMAQLRAFNVGPVQGKEGGSYACMYQFSKRRRLVNSTVSNIIQVTVTDLLPRPTLTLQQQEGVWHLSCQGSAAYPGSRFFLYRSDIKLTVATHRASMSSHQNAFPIPVQVDQAVAQYECSYSILLGKHLSDSERSLSLQVAQGLPSVDWPLVAGSFSAVILFIAAVVLLLFAVHRKVRGATTEKKRREEAVFWSRGQGKDHMADLAPRQSTFNSHEWAKGTTESVPTASLWNPLSTFSSPSFH
ncbi:hypothetical protein NHX12_017958, partial [Muraenolepis orangiensis]